MSKKTGMPEPTLHRIIKAIKTREYLPRQVSEKITWRDIDRTRPLKNNPEIRKDLSLPGESISWRDIDRI